MALNGLRVFG
uniref:Uncharacterized protein n=1 Tax=Anguilla anguilla TaxID=7936 RepID=A0A0E9QKJ9_ANGAN